MPSIINRVGVTENVVGGGDGDPKTSDKPTEVKSAGGDAKAAVKSGGNSKPSR